MLAPSARECLRRGWLEQAVATLGEKVDRHGLAYVSVPLLWRRRTVALLRSAGLVPRETFVHLPSRQKSAHLVPAQAGPLRHAITNLMATRRWKRVLAELVLSRRSVASRVADFLPATGFVAMRPDAATPLAWLASVEPSAGEFQTATLSIGRDGSSVVLHVFFEGGDEPDLVVKLGLTDRTRRARTHEAAVLSSLRAAATATGVDVPAVVARAPAHDDALVETVLAGRPVAGSLADEPHLLPDVLGELADWLERWHLETRTKTTLDEALVETVLARARAVGAEVQGGGPYVRWLEHLCTRASGSVAPLVAVHNDLTMVNVLRRPDGRLAIVDWEAAAEQGFPLTDFFYAAADAAAATSRYADRAGAFAATFLADGPMRSHVDALRARLCRRLDLEPAFPELCFHACWLMHAVNEQASTRRGRTRPFLAIVQLLADETSTQLQ